MKTTDIIRTAMGNTFRSRLRTTLTVLALFIGAFTLTLTTALGAGVTDYVTKQVASLGADDVLIITASSTTSAGDGPTKYDPTTSSASTGAGSALPGAGSGGALTDGDLAELRANPELSNVSPIKTVSVDYVATASSDKYEFSIAPTSSVAQSDLADGTQLDSDTKDRQLILPDTYVSALGFGSASEAVGTTVTIGLTDVLGKQHDVTATLVGISNTSLLSSGGGANEALVNELASIQSAGIQAPARYPVAVAHFDPNISTTKLDSLKNSIAADGMTAQTIADQLGIITTVIAGITGILNAFAIVALLAAAFGIVNTLLMSVQERTREIGLMKAMGMSSGRVFALFSFEAAFIGFLGSALGAFMAILAGIPLSGALSVGPLSGLSGLHLLIFQPGSIVGVVILIVTIAFVAGTLPAFRAARKTPIEALRYE
jgi:putative ABC transport system permease protein